MIKWLLLFVFVFKLAQRAASVDLTHAIHITDAYKMQSKQNAKNHIRQTGNEMIMYKIHPGLAEENPTRCRNAEQICSHTLCI